MAPAPVTPGKKGFGRPKYGLCRPGTEAAAWRWLENNGLRWPPTAGPGAGAGGRPPNRDG